MSTPFGSGCLATVTRRTFCRHHPSGPEHVRLPACIDIADGALAVTISASKRASPPRLAAETLECYDEGAIEEEELAPFGLVLELFEYAVVERRIALHARPVEPSGGQLALAASHLGDRAVDNLSIATTVRASEAAATTRVRTFRCHVSGPSCRVGRL
jgi:hypothetical protein